MFKERGRKIMVSNIYDVKKGEPLIKMLDNNFKVKSDCVIRILQSRLKRINEQLSKQHKRNIIKNYSARIKSVESTKQKLNKKGYDETYEMALEKINDLVGVRAVCFYLDDLYEVANCLNEFHEIKVIEIKDYIKRPKSSGYRSLHLIVQVLIYFQNSLQWVKAEVQLRTITMDHWAKLDHRLRYKCGNIQEEQIDEHFKKYSRLLQDIDKRLIKFRDKRC